MCIVGGRHDHQRVPGQNSSHTAGPSLSGHSTPNPAHGPFQRADHDLMEELALAEALVDPVLVASPHGPGGGLRPRADCTRPGGSPHSLLTAETQVVDNQRSDGRQSTKVLRRLR